MKRIFLLLFLGSLNLQAQESAPGSPQGEARGGEGSCAAFDWSALGDALNAQASRTEEQQAADLQADRERQEKIWEAERLRLGVLE